MANLPTGTITLLFTDIEGSTRRWEQDAGEMNVGLARHDRILRGAIEGHGGSVFKTIGDAFCAAFDTAPIALAAALAAQRAFQSVAQDEVEPLRVRMALHTGAVEMRDDDYFGPTLNRVARLLSTGYGGQILLSLATQELVCDALPEGCVLRDLGEHALKDLVRPEHIFQLVVPDLPNDFPALKTLDARPNNLPVQTAPLVGREHEVAEVCVLLRDAHVRLLTLTGPGGTGKTRLGLHVAGNLLDDFAGGVFFVPLAPISDAGLVAGTIAQMLDVRETRAQPLLESLKDYLRVRQMLLVLDNFEQVVGAAPLISDLLAGAPRLKVLVTSRAVLHLYGEHEFPVPPLALPDLKRLPPPEHLSQYDAVRLFIERAQAIKPEFTVTNVNAAAIAEICIRLDGLPLAIELAAARSKLLPPQALLSRLGNRLQMLTGGARDLTARQRTLRGTIDWSYNLLDRDEQRLFVQLGVFAGGCSLEAAEAICDGAIGLEVDVLEGIQSLLDKSLLRQREGVDAEPRFEMLETIREYARERLAEHDETDLRRRHAAFFLEQAERAEPKLTSGDRKAWLERLEAEHDNLRAALAWSRSEDGEMHVRLAGALWWFWYFHGYLSEERASLDTALALSQPVSRPPTATRTKLLTGAGALAFVQSDLTAARRFALESVDLARAIGNKRDLAFALAFRGQAAESLAYAVSFLEESLSLFRALGDHWGLALALVFRGYVALHQSDFAAAQAFSEESAALFRGMMDEWGLGWALHNLGWALEMQGDFGQAKAVLEECVLLSRAVGDTWAVSWASTRLGYVAHALGDLSAAATRFKESLELFREQGDKQGISYCLTGLGMVASALGNSPGEHKLASARRAVRLLGAVEALRASLDTPPQPLFHAGDSDSLAAVRSQLDEAEFRTAWARGREMSLEQAIAYAQESTAVS